MKYRRLGSSELVVSVIGYGTWEIGWKDYDISELEKAVDFAVNHGINFFDTAPVYGFGESEKIIGRILKPYKNKVYIATKCGLRWDDIGNVYRNLKRDSILYEIEQSLKRLDVNIIDLYQVHWPDPNTPIKETFSALRELLDSGVAKYIGVSNYGPDLIEEALEYCPIVSNQIVYNYFQRGIEREVIPYCASKNISIIAYSPICQGLAICKYDENTVFPPDDPRMYNLNFYNRERFIRNVRRAKSIKLVADRLNVSVSQLALSWVLYHDVVATAIVGTTKVSHVEDNIKASEFELRSEIKSEIDAFISDEEIFW